MQEVQASQIATSAPASAAVVTPKYTLNKRVGEKLVKVGDVLSKEGPNGAYLIVDGTDLIIGQNDEGRFQLKGPNPKYVAGSDVKETMYKNTILTSLFHNTHKKDGTPCKSPYYGGKTLDGIQYLMFPYSPKPAGKGGFKRRS